MSTLKLNKPDKTKVAEQLGMRFVDRKGRYMLQARQAVIYEVRASLSAGAAVTMKDHTWVDVPLVVETYT